MKEAYLMFMDNVWPDLCTAYGLQPHDEPPADVFDCWLQHEWEKQEERRMQAAPMLTAYENYEQNFRGVK
jgi:hypothetical protein